jgi:transcriptional regulator with XRE-family HTH domain
MALNVLWVSATVLSPEERPVLWLLLRPEYARLVEMLVAVRHLAGVRQQKLAEKLGKPQSFIAKYEGGERRFDLIEFIAIARALGADPVKLFRDFVVGEAGTKARRKGPAK